MTNKDDANITMGITHLRRLETFLDVAYAVLFVYFITYLPLTEDMKWINLEFGLLSLLWDNSLDLLRISIGVSLTMISWNFTHKLLGPLERTNWLHTLLTFLQLIFVCLFLFFATADPELVSISSLVGQSICLAISGFIGIAGWQYARMSGFTKAEFSKSQKDGVVSSTILEPTTALLNTGLGFVGPGIWTLGWFFIPLLLIGVKRLMNN